MSKKGKKYSPGGIIYSTDPDFSFEGNDEGGGTPPPAGQQLRVRLDTKHRRGKTVTLVEGFTGKKEDLEALGKKLKTACGSGGSAKDNLILVQGEHEGQVKELLKEWGYGVK